MVNLIRNLRIFSAITELLDGKESNLAKMEDKNRQKQIPFLQNEGFDGWLSSIDNQWKIDIVIRTDPILLKIVECLPIQFSWRNSFQKQDKIIPKNWGSVYPLSTGPFQLILNQRFKSQIENQQKQLEEEDPRDYTFAIFLENAEIIQINAPIQQIRWIKEN